MQKEKINRLALEIEGFRKLTNPTNHSVDANVGIPPYNPLELSAKRYKTGTKLVQKSFI